MKYVFLGLALAVIAWVVKHWRDIVDLVDMMIFRGDK